MINFSNSVNLENLTNFSLHIDIRDKLINVSVNKSVTDLNRSALLSFRGVTYTNPGPIRNGVTCSNTICREVSYNNNIYVINVTGFSAYGVEETGGGGNSGGSGGNSGGGTSGRGGGGGSGVSIATAYKLLKETIDQIFRKDTLFDVKLELLTGKHVYAGEEVRANITLLNFGCVDCVDLFLEYRIKDMKNKVVNVKEETIIIGNKSKSFVRSFVLPEDVDPTSYMFWVKASYNSQTAIASEVFDVVEVGEKRDNRRMFKIRCQTVPCEIKHLP